jgi:hypothetical protein
MADKLATYDNRGQVVKMTFVDHIGYITEIELDWDEMMKVYELMQECLMEHNGLIAHKPG